MFNWGPFALGFEGFTALAAASRPVTETVCSLQAAYSSRLPLSIWWQISQPRCFWKALESINVRTSTGNFRRNAACQGQRNCIAQGSVCSSCAWISMKFAMESLCPAQPTMLGSLLHRQCSTRKLTNSSKFVVKNPYTWEFPKWLLNFAYPYVPTKNPWTKKSHVTCKVGPLVINLWTYNTF